MASATYMWKRREARWENSGSDHGCVSRRSSTANSANIVSSNCVRYQPYVKAGSSRKMNSSRYEFRMKKAKMPIDSTTKRDGGEHASRSKHRKRSSVAEDDTGDVEPDTGSEDSADAEVVGRRW